MSSMVSAKTWRRRKTPSSFQPPPRNLYSGCRERMIDRIKSVGKRELMREARIAMRKINEVHDGKEIPDDDLKRMANAAERIDKRRKARDEEAAAAVAWLKAKRDEIGLAAPAKLLKVDVADLAKVI